VIGIKLIQEIKMESITKIVGVVVLGTLLGVVLGLLMSLPVMWLWNGCLVPAINEAHEISWLQAWGILILFGFLFKSPGYHSKD
jgi:hypothetical protein